MNPNNQYPAGTLNLAPVEDALYDWVYGLTQGILEDPSQVLWRNQSEPLPARPCITLKWISGPSPIARSANVLNNPGQANTTFGVQMEATLSVQTYGNTKIKKRRIAHQLAIDLNSSLLRESILTQLYQSGIGVQSVGKPQNLSALERLSTRNDMALRIGLGLAQNVFEDTGSITTINVEKTVDGNSLPTQPVVVP